MSNADTSWLSKPIQDLPFTFDFRRVTAKHGFNTVGEMAVLHVSDLMKIEGFNYHLLQEFTQFMVQHKLSHLIKQH